MQATDQSTAQTVAHSVEHSAVHSAEHSAEHSAQPSVEHPAPTTAASPAAQAGHPILVIDDSSTIRRSAEIFLGQAGYPVVLADDGFAALSVILEHKPALVFCDIQMPRLDGFQTCALIRRHPDYRHLRFVLLSSRDGVFDRARGHLAGANAYLTKPFTKDSLLRTVSEQLAAAGATAEPALLTTELPSP